MFKPVMKSSFFVIFVTIVLTLYGLINWYIYSRGSQALSGFPEYKPYYISIFLLLSLSYVIARFVGKFLPEPVNVFFNFTGSFWLAAIAYFFLSIILIDFVRLLNHFFDFYPAFIKGNYINFKFYLASGLAVLIVVLIFTGYINAKNPRIKTLDISIHKKTKNITELNIVAVSDIHLGVIIGEKNVAKLVEKINSLNPDVILLAGDIFDEDLEPVISKNLGEYLRNLKAPSGVYAVTGNHEYIGGFKQACKYMEEHNIKVLIDCVVNISDNFYIVGRNDKDAVRFGGKPRKSLKEIVKDIDKSLPVILLDHQPFRLNDAMENGIDLQISGHTHHGQIWPFNYITGKVFELSRGYKQKGNTHYYVSTGYGTWGPPVRLGNRPEIMNFKLHFIKEMIN